MMNDIANETGDDLGPSSAQPRRRPDPLSLISGVVLLAVALAVLVERHWVGIDAVAATGGIIIVIGLAIAATAVRNIQRRNESLDR